MQRLPLARHPLGRTLTAGPSEGPLPLDIEGLPAASVAFSFYPLKATMVGQPVADIYSFDDSLPHARESAELLSLTLADIDLEADAYNTGGALITKMYDHSGNDAHVTTSASVLFAMPSMWYTDGRMSIFPGGYITTDRHEGFGDTTNGFHLDNTSEPSLNTRDFSVYLVGDILTLDNATATAGPHANTVFSPGFNGSDLSGGFWWWLSQGDTADEAPSSGWYQTVSWDSGSESLLKAPRLSCNRAIHSLHGDAVASYFGFNETLVAGAPMPASTATGARFLGGFFYGGFDDSPFIRCDAMIVFPNKLTTEQHNTLVARLKKLYGIKDPGLDPNRVAIFVNGASLDQGQGGDPVDAYDFGYSGGGYGPWTMIKDRYAQSKPWVWYMMPSSGDNNEDCATKFASVGQHCYDPGAKLNIAVLGGSAVGNDGFQGRTAQQAYDGLAAMVATAVAKGFKPGTYLYDTTGETIEDIGAAFNALVEANADAIGLKIFARNVDVPSGSPYENAGGDHYTVFGYENYRSDIEAGFVAWIEEELAALE